MKSILFFPSVWAVLSCSTLLCHSQNSQGTQPIHNPAEPKEKGVPSLEFRRYQVPSDFLSKGAPSTSDPNTSAPATVKDVLESLGVFFDTPGARASYYPGTAFLEMTNTRQQLDNLDSILSQSMIDTVLQGQVHLEAFSMPPLTARTALITHPKEKELYAWIDAQSAKPGSGVKLERHTITFVRGGQRSKTEAFNQITYSARLHPPAVPQSVSPPMAPASTITPNRQVTFPPGSHTEPNPDDMVIRNAGDTVEMELTFMGDDLKSVDINLAAETCRLIGFAKFGALEEIYQPIFQTQKSSAQAAGLIGQPMLISTFSPPVNTGVPGGNTVDRTWLLFVTVKEPE